MERLRKKWKGVPVWCIVLSMIAIIASVSAASYWVFSNVVTVTVTEYVLTLAPESQTVVRYHNATFTATLTLGGSPVSGATIWLFKGDENTGVSNVTGTDGTCTLSYNMTETAGTYNFKAGYQAP
jgi:hypothetical protein